jgi:hypothetical protein
MKKRTYTLQKDLTLLSFSLFVIVAIWIAFSLYGIYVTSTISDTLQTQIIPIDNRFSAESISTLRKRTPVAPIYTSTASESADTIILDTLPNSPEQLSPIFSPTPDISQSATPSAGGPL